MIKRNHVFCKICCFCILDFVLFFQLLTKLGKPWKILKPKQNVWTSLKKLELKRTTWYTVKSIQFMQSLDAFIFPRALIFLELCLVGTYIMFQFLCSLHCFNKQVISTLIQQSGDNRGSIGTAPCPDYQFGRIFKYLANNYN